MKNQKVICLILALAMSIFLFVGCVGEDAISLNELLGLATAAELTGETDETDFEPTPIDNMYVPTEIDTTGAYSDGLDDNGFWIGIRALDYVDFPNYSSLPIPYDVYYVDDEVVQSEIDSILYDFPNNELVTNREVVMGDTVNIDFVGSIDGIAFAGGSTEGMGTDVIIGETAYIDDFLEQLIGHKPGTVVNVEVTFPEDYYQEDLQGKDALFVTNINHIVGGRLELTDEFILENLFQYYGWATIYDMRNSIISELQKSSIQQYVQLYVVSEVTVKSIPEQLMKYQENLMVVSLQQSAEYYGMDFDEFIFNYEGVTTIAELKEQYHDKNVENATYALVLQAVAEAAGIKIGEAELEDYFMMLGGSPDYSMYVDLYGLPFIKEVVLCEVAINYIVANVVFS